MWSRSRHTHHSRTRGFLQSTLRIRKQYHELNQDPFFTSPSSPCIIIFIHLMLNTRAVGIGSLDKLRTDQVQSVGSIEDREWHLFESVHLI